MPVAEVADFVLMAVAGVASETLAVQVELPILPIFVVAWGRMSGGDWRWGAIFRRFRRKFVWPILAVADSADFFDCERRVRGVMVAEALRHESHGSSRLGKWRGEARQWPKWPIFMVVVMVRMCVADVELPILPIFDLRMMGVAGVVRAHAIERAEHCIGQCSMGWVRGARGTMVDIGGQMGTVSRGI